MVVGDINSCDEETLKDDKKHRLKQRFDVRQKLGQGTYGKVQLALNRGTNQEVAIKTIKKSKIESEQDLIRIRREIQIMSSIQHPHIIHIYEVFENKDKIVLVMQFASGGELYDYLSEKKVLSDLEARRIFRQIAAAVYYCHKNKICHRDLKLENILLDEKGNAKIADFGLSNVFDERHLLKTYCGSPLYASPEIVKGVPYYGPEVDCWSMGVLLYTLVYGAMPFDGSNFKKLVTQISDGEYFEPKKKSKASDLIQRLLAVNPLKRATIVDICTDYWVNQGYEHSLLQVAEDMANLTPVRLDLLLALAPASPIPASDTEGEYNAKDESEIVHKTVLDKEVEEEEEEEEEEDNADTMANSFAFVRGSQVSNFSTSTPDLQKTFVDDEQEDENFIPSGLAAAMEGHCGKRAADGSLAHVSSIAHKNKKTRKSDSIMMKDVNSSVKETPLKNEDAAKYAAVAVSKAIDSQPSPDSLGKLPAKEGDSQAKSEADDVRGEESSKDEKSICSDQPRKSSVHDVAKSIEAAAIAKSTSSECDDKSTLQKKKMGRPPGKIVIPKTFESPQSTPSPRSNSKNSPVQLNNTLSEAKLNAEESETPLKAEEPSSFSKPLDSEENPIESSNESSKTIDRVTEPEPVSEEKKIIAKGILKKGIAKAKLAERKLSQQSSVDSDVSTPPISSVKAPESVPSFYKTPKPYSKQEDQQLKSEAEITLSSAKQNTKEKMSDIKVISSAPLWDSAPSNQQPKESQSKNMSWGTISSTLDSEIGGWRESVEESLKRLSPDGSTEKSLSPIGRSEDDKPLVPIARSYKKFTFTKDGACITETKKIYTTPGADGSWTKVEKKTRITTRPGNADEFEKFRDLHLRNNSPLTKSDSQSSSGSNDMYDDIFDSWTGDSMMCNMVKIKNMFQKFSQDPFLRAERRRNPFRNFRRTESDRSERNYRRVELPSGHSTDKESSDNDEDNYEVAFAGSNPVVYGSQGLWNFLRPPHRRLQRHVMISQPEHAGFSRSVSQDRSGSKISNWKQFESRASSGYNTSRSQSRDRTQSPHEKVLRFVFESPDHESANNNKKEWVFKRGSNRRDSGINSDGYESEHSYRRAPSDDFSKSGRVSPMSSMCSTGRQGMIREFVKAWPKDVMLHHNKVNEAADNRRHKVEQWLHMNDMNDDKFPFNFHCEPHSRISPRKTSIHDNISSAYATMRPREYMKYNRSSSDKISTSSVELFPFSETSQSRNVSRSHSKDQEIFKGPTQSTSYSPISEDSNREAHSLRNSDSSHSNTSVHHINFTFSDGRVTTSQSASPSSLPYVQQRNDDGDHYPQNNSRNISTEHPPISVKNSGQPIVEMRVSFNRGNRDNKVVHITSQSPPSPVGLWQQQQDHPSALKASSIKCVDPPREPSPIPGIKKFSTEMVHTIGSTVGNPPITEQFREGRPSSIECEVKATVKSQGTLERGKSFNDMPEFVCSDTFFDACPRPCMENTKKNTNLNLHPCYSQLLNSELHDNELFLSPKNDKKEINTPDSLEDSNFDSSVQHYDNLDFPQPRIAAVKSLKPEIKPIGVLWNNPEMADYSSFKQLDEETTIPPRRLLPSRNALNSSSLDSIPKSQLWGDAPYNAFGSIWEQKNNNCQTFDLINELLSDDTLDNSAPLQCIAESPETRRIENKNICSRPGTKDTQMLKMQVSPLTVLDTISVIEGYKLRDSNEAEFTSLVPSVMDDLQSPKKVLHQALRIGKSLQSCE